MSDLADDAWGEGNADDMREFTTTESQPQQDAPPSYRRMPRPLVPITLDGHDCYERCNVDDYVAAMDEAIAAERKISGQLRAALTQAREALEKVRSHVLTATHPVAKGSDDMLVSAARIFEAFEYVDAALAATKEP